MSKVTYGVCFVIIVYFCFFLELSGGLAVVILAFPGYIHLCFVSPQRDIDKQCRSSLESAFDTYLFLNYGGIKTKLTPFLLKMHQSKEIWAEESTQHKFVRV